MALAYVYAPFSGTVTQGAVSTHCPCTDCSPSCGCASTYEPVDIATSAGVSINLYVNYPTVRSISYDMTTTDPFECCDGNSDANLKRAVKVHLYGAVNYCCYIGWVLFGHINLSGFSLVNGNIAANYCGQLGTVLSAPNPPISCYSGPHEHMEASTSGVLLRSSGTVTGGTTALYQWSFSTPCPC